MQRIRWSQERSAGGEEGERCAGFELAELAEFDEFAGIGEFDDLNEFNAFDEFDERGSRRKGWEDGARRNAVSVVFLAQTKRAFEAEYAESVGNVGGIHWNRGIRGIRGIQDIVFSDSLDGNRSKIRGLLCCLFESQCKEGERMGDMEVYSAYMKSLIH